jgi:hypothetical protein
LAFLDPIERGKLGTAARPNHARYFDSVGPFYSDFSILEPRRTLLLACLPEDPLFQYLAQISIATSNSPRGLLVPNYYLLSSCTNLTISPVPSR